MSYVAVIALGSSFITRLLGVQWTSSEHTPLELYILDSCDRNVDIGGNGEVVARRVGR